MIRETDRKGRAPMKADEILKTADAENVHFMRLEFTDIMGVLKNVEIPRSQFEKALEGHIMFDGSSIEGFTRIEESDMLLAPDLDTFQLNPWKNPDGTRVARLICDVKLPDGSPFPGCPRTTLKRQVERAAKMGYSMVAGPEAEFFLFQKDGLGKTLIETHDVGGYFDLTPVDKGEEARRDIVIMLEQMGFEVEAAKPIFGVNGSGMHTHQSLLTKDGKNAFFDPKAPRELSKVALSYIAGILEHAKAFVAITNPLVNSYKRLVPGFEAPINVAWSEKNRSPLVRVPAKRGMSTRCEVRVPDPSCNPYLALAAMLAAGLDGISRKLDPGEPVNKNIFTMSERQKRRLKIRQLPANLSEALDNLEKDDVVKGALGPHIFDNYIRAKRQEWADYISHVHPWEQARYLEAY
jgi:glutamine synthetase